jgi:hypothetical protein
MTDREPVPVASKWDRPTIVALVVLVALILLAFALPWLLHVPGNLQCYAYNCQ